jgi:tRNA (cytosine38-C5)-methyltransferase
MESNELEVPKTLSAIEFYSGIGGLHQSARIADVNVSVVTAFEINPNANLLYESNFKVKVNQVIPVNFQ